jgi:hypothetical protein
MKDEKVRMILVTWRIKAGILHMVAVAEVVIDLPFFLTSVDSTTVEDFLLDFKLPLFPAVLPATTTGVESDGVVTVPTADDGVVVFASPPPVGGVFDNAAARSD